MKWGADPDEREKQMMVKSDLSWVLNVSMLTMYIVYILYWNPDNIQNFIIIIIS